MTGATTITDVMDAIEASLATLQVDGTPITAYGYEPGYEGMQVPSATIFIPSLERPDLNQSESVMGADDWDYTFLLQLYVDLFDARTNQRQLAVLLADAILLFDADMSLGGLALECRIHKAVSGTVHTDQRTRALLNYECELRVRRLIDTLY